MSLLKKIKDFFGTGNVAKLQERIEPTLYSEIRDQGSIYKASDFPIGHIMNVESIGTRRGETIKYEIIEKKDCKYWVLNNCILHYDEEQGFDSFREEGWD